MNQTIKEYKKLYRKCMIAKRKFRTDSMSVDEYMGYIRESGGFKNGAYAVDHVTIGYLLEVEAEIEQEVDYRTEMEQYTDAI